MKKNAISKKLMIFFVLLLFFTPSLTNAVSVSYLEPGYTNTEFLVLDFWTISMAFDNNRNLYTSTKDFSSGTINILQFDAASSYAASSVYSSYSSNGFVTGLVFDSTGDLYVSEFITGDFGRIRKIDSTSKSVVENILLPDFRPTGISIGPDENIYFNGALGSDLYCGSIYRTNSTEIVETVFEDFVGTGIALNNSGDIYSSTLEYSVPYSDASIYMLDSECLTPSLFATFNQYAEELTFDYEDNLYALFTNSDYTSTIMKISPNPIPEPTTILLLGSGLIGFAGFRRKMKNRRE